ncbi:hypothetical protein ABPG72_012104 [Tetrahymena utriculariae]
MAKHKELKHVLESFFLKNKNKGKPFMKRRFKEFGAPKRSLNRWLKMLYEGKSLSRKVGSGRIPKIATKETIKKLNKYFNHKSGVSQRKFANKVGCSQSYVNRLLKKKTNISCYKKTKQPKMTIQQQEDAKSKCDILRKKYRNVDFILDDESYFTLSHTTLSGNDRFYSSDLNLTSHSVKYDFKMKFEPKILLWIAISLRGISKPYIAQRGITINQEIYRDHCLKSRLLPMIKDLYLDEKYIFWPDKASAHYAVSVTKFLNDNNIKFVQKEDNPTSIPQARSIEDFWAHLKQQVYKNDWSAKTIEQLEERIKSRLKIIDTDFVLNLASQTHKRILEIATHGIQYNKN